MKRILSALLAITIITTMMSCVFGLTASANEANDNELAAIKMSLLGTISTDTWSSRWNDSAHIDATGFKGGNEFWTCARYKGSVDISENDWVFQFTYNQPQASNINSYLAIGDMQLKYTYTVGGEVTYTLTSGSDSNYKPLGCKAYATGDSGDYLTSTEFNSSTIKVERIENTLKFYRNGEVMVFANGVSEFDATKFNFNANAGDKQIDIFSWAPLTVDYWVKDITLIQPFKYKTVDQLNAYLAGIAYVDNTSVDAVKNAVAVRDAINNAVAEGVVSSATYDMIDFTALDAAVAEMDNNKVTQFDVTAGVGGKVDAVTTRDFYIGDTYTIKATANTGYVFKEWQDADGNQIATSAEYTVTLAKTNSFTAVFDEDWDNDYSITSCDDGLGTVAGDGFTIGDDLRVGQSYTVVATPAEACVLTDWTVNGNVAADTDSYTFTYVKGIQIVANFRMVDLADVTVNTEGVGTVSVQGTSYHGKYAVGDEIILSASFDYKDGYIFDHWEKNGQNIGTSAYLKQTVEEGLVITAVFTNDINKLADYEIAEFAYPLINPINKNEWNDRGGNSSSINDGVGISGSGSSAMWAMYKGFVDLSNIDFKYTFTYNCPNINKIEHHYTALGSLTFNFNTLNDKFTVTGGTSGYNPLSGGAYIYASGDSGRYVTKEEYYTSKITLVRKGDKFYFYRNDQLMVFSNGVSEFDATKFDFNANANSSQLRFQIWVPNSTDIVIKDISLSKLLGYNNMDELNAYLDSVDVTDKDALAAAQNIVDYMKANTLYIKDKIDYNALKKAKYNFTASEGGKITVDGAEFVNDYNVNRILVGETVTLTAVADEGYSFYFWKSADGTIVSRDASLSLALPRISGFTAVFTKKDAANVTVYFKNRSGKIVSSQTVASGTQITLPSTDTVGCYGYTVKSWVIDGVAYNSGAVFTAVKDTVIYGDYVRNAQKYTVTVSGSDNDDAVSGEYGYNTAITVSFTAELQDGQVFAGWYNGGICVSRNTTYKFFVGSDVELTAVIAEAVDEMKPIIAVTNVSVVINSLGSESASFLTERSVCDGYKFVESGVIYTTDADAELALENVDGAAVRQNKVSSLNDNGQYRLSVGSSKGANITVRLVAYLTYVDSNGDVYTIYTNVYSQEINAAE